MSDFTEIQYISPQEAVFEETGGGFISMEFNGENYKRVNVFRCYPFSAENEFISIRNEDNKEIGIIRNLEDFDKKTAKLIRKHLDIRYFTPVITHINKIIEEFGFTYWDTVTDRGACRFTVRNERSSYIRLSESHVIIVDIDGNRFEIEDINRMPHKEIRKVLFI